MKSSRLATALVATAVGLGVASLPAISHAAPPDYRVAVTPKKNVGSSVKVKVSGLPRTVGVYVRLCAKTSGRPAAAQCFGGTDRSGRWVIQKYPYGARAAGTVNPAKGWFRLPVAQRFGSVDCARQPCVISVRRDHRNGGDYSYDRSIRVRF